MGTVSLLCLWLLDELSVGLDLLLDEKYSGDRVLWWNKTVLFASRNSTWLISGCTFPPQKKQNFEADSKSHSSSPELPQTKL